MELWDVLDGNGRRTGRTTQRGAPLAEGEYHLVVHVWIVNSRGEFLITKRSAEKSFLPDLWDTTCGSALAGEESLEAALREVGEETGLSLDAAGGRMLGRYKRHFPPLPSFVDVWLFDSEAGIGELRLQESEVSEARWASAGEIMRLKESGEFVPTAPYLAEVFSGVEMWDVLDENGSKTGRTVRRGDRRSPEEMIYHLVVNAIIRGPDGRYLITKRSTDKSCLPDLWEVTGGSALAGEGSLEAVLREVFEEIGLSLEPGAGILLKRYKRPEYPDFLDVWLFRAGVDLNALRLQEGEVADARWASAGEIMRMLASGEFAPVFTYLEELLEE